jgi:hypothetical protein
MRVKRGKNLLLAFANELGIIFSKFRLRRTIR